MKHLLTSLARGYREVRDLNRVLGPELRRLYWTDLALPHIGAAGLAVFLFAVSSESANVSPVIIMLSLAMIGGFWVVGVVVSIKFHRDWRKEFVP